MKSQLAVITCGIALVALVSTCASAQSETGANALGPNAPVSDPDGPQAAPDSFGTQDRSVLWIPMAAFQGRNGYSSFSYSGLGYVSRATGSDLLWSPLTLPNGALVDTVRLWMYDQSAGNIGFYLTEYGGNHDDTNDIASAWSSGTGETSIAISPAYTLNYTSDYYVLNLSMPIDSNIRAKGFRVLWYRQVSAAPASATFSDVPTSSAYFRYVEAVVDAGLTGGCGGSNYCPDTPVTRGQMAVFLSTALGLHHPF